MKLDPKCLGPFGSPLVSFNRDRIHPKGIISLPAGTHPVQVIREVDFLIIECPLSSNVILGWPTLNRLKAIASTYCLKVIFPTPHEIGEICGDQFLAKKCYQVVLASKENHTWMVEEEPPKPMEETEDIKLVEGNPSKTTKVGKKLQRSLTDEGWSFWKRTWMSLHGATKICWS